MHDYHKPYAHFADIFLAQGINVATVKDALKQQRMETLSWGYANRSMHFKVFPWLGDAYTIREKLDDGAHERHATIKATTDRLDAITDVDYVICTICP
jgi:L-rhamnose isomerase